jgi:hypothetical protein
MSRKKVSLELLAELKSLRTLGNTFRTGDCVQVPVFEGDPIWLAWNNRVIICRIHELPYDVGRLFWIQSPDVAERMHGPYTAKELSRGWASD